MAAPSPDLEHPAFRPLEVQRVQQGRQNGVLLLDRLGIAEPTFVPEELLPIVGRFDGAKSVTAVCAELADAHGESVPETFVHDLVRQLDERLVLRSPRFEQALGSQVRAFLAAGTRPCRHAGSAGYARDPERLRAELARMVPKAAAARPALRGLVAPHIDLQRGHAGYAAAYGRLLQSAPADLYVVFGTGHAGPSAPVTGLPLDWETPLGVARTDRAFVAAVHDALGNATDHDLFLHRDEHSLEFQVLLLQHLAEQRGSPPFEVACFLCGSLPSATGDPSAAPHVQRLVGAFRTAATRSGKQVCFLAGADLAHLGPFFGDPTPVDHQLRLRLDADERARLSQLERGAAGAFHAAVMQHDNPDRVCSATSMYLVGELAGGTAELLHYGQAVAADGSQVVSFCGLGYG